MGLTVVGDGAAEVMGSVGVGGGSTVAVTVAVVGSLVGVRAWLVVRVFSGVWDWVGAGVVDGELDGDALGGGLVRLGLLGTVSVRVGAGCPVAVVGDLVVVSDRDTEGVETEPSPPQEATSTARRPMTAARRTRADAAYGTWRCRLTVRLPVTGLVLRMSWPSRVRPPRRGLAPRAAGPHQTRVQPLAGASS